MICSKTLSTVTALAFVASLAGCATSPQYGYGGGRTNTDASCIAATIGGAVAGGVVGNQFGKGHGREAMTAVGAVGGAMAGQQLCEPTYGAPSNGYNQRN